MYRNQEKEILLSSYTWVKSLASTVREIENAPERERERLQYYQQNGYTYSLKMYTNIILASIYLYEKI